MFFIFVAVFVIGGGFGFFFCALLASNSAQELIDQAYTRGKQDGVKHAELNAEWQNLREKAQEAVRHAAK